MSTKKIKCPICGHEVEVEVVELPEEPMFFEIFPAAKFAKVECPCCKALFKGELFNDGTEGYYDDNAIEESVIAKVETFKKTIEKIDLNRLGALVLSRYLDEVGAGDITEEKLLDFNY